MVKGTTICFNLVQARFSRMTLTIIHREQRSFDYKVLDNARV